MSTYNLVIPSRYIHTGIERYIDLEIEIDVDNADTDTTHFFCLPSSGEKKYRFIQLTHLLGAAKRPPLDCVDLFPRLIPYEKAWQEYHPLDTLALAC